MNEVKQLDVNIMGREFRVACSVDEEDLLLQSVAMLDARMHEIRAGGKVIGMEKVAIMAALNIALEYLHTQVADGLDLGSIQRRIERMNASLDNALQEQSELF